MGKNVCVIGGTGLVGHQLILQLLQSPKIESVTAFGRKSSGIVHEKLNEIEIDFDNTESWKSLVVGDILYSSLGTTLKTAKTKSNQYKVDFTYQYEFAKIAFENNIPVYVLVSSMGANSKSSVFYSRIKGELEDEINKLGFRKALVFRPSILDGNRRENRVGEKIGLVVTRILTRFAFKKYKPTPVDLFAKKMISLSLNDTDGFRIIEGLQVFED